MSHPNRVRFTPRASVAWAIALSIAGAINMAGARTHAQTNAGTSAQADSAIPAPPSGSPAGPLAYSCGAPTAQAGGGRGQQPVFPSGRYPVQLPAVSLLGARNDLPNPYQPGVDWGQLPPGRKWGSTASVTTAPDGTIWVVDRCGNSGAGGT
jgi:hypothetical protein